MREAAKIERLAVCIGAQKAGTTWLARIMARHPDIFVTPVKEIHYFDHLQGISEKLSDRKRRSRRRKYRLKLCTQWGRWSELWGQRAWYSAYLRDPLDDAWYASLFAGHGRAVALEATPEYALIGEAGFRHLHRLAPEARLIYILRNPVERAWSQVLHLCRRQGLDARRLAAERLIAMAETPAVAAHGDYGRALDAVGAVFPPDRLLVAFYEDIHADRLAALQRLCGFLGVTFSPDVFGRADRRYNVSQEAAMPAPVRAHLQRKYAPLAAAIERRLGHVPDTWRRTFAGGSTVAQATPPR